MSEHILIFCTCPDEVTATGIASRLVEDKLAACVNLLPAITSIYFWQGEVAKDSEVQLLIKSSRARFEQINQLIRSIHPYDTPEIIATDIVVGDNRYLTWINDTVK